MGRSIDNIIKLYKDFKKRTGDYGEYTDDTEYNIITKLKNEDIKKYLKDTEEAITKHKNITTNIELITLMNKKTKYVIDSQYMNIEMGSILYMYAIETKNNELLFMLIDKNISLNCIFHEQFFRDEGFKSFNINMSILEKILFLLFFVYIFKQKSVSDEEYDNEEQYDDSEYAKNFYSAYGPFCYGMKEKDIIVLYVDIILHYNEKHEISNFNKDKNSTMGNLDSFYTEINSFDKDVIQHLEEREQESREIGAVKTELFNKGKLHGDLKYILNSYIKRRSGKKSRKNRRKRSRKKSRKSHKRSRKKSRKTRRKRKRKHK